MMETTNLQLHQASVDRAAIDAPMDTADACEYLKVSERTLSRWIDAEGMPVHRIGRTSNAARRFYRSELDAWIRNRWSDDGAEYGHGACA